mmetsp:Transcript_4910/g.4805  ORF Transcript_4910/g.4805 Transcript_4910/m.4805 type:complete len:215 (+) Transcript_4910:31-675(+)
MSTKRPGFSREETNRALTLIKFLEEQPESFDFHHPVDFKGLGLDDYPLIIKKPMDLSTIKKNLKNSRYNSFEEFLQDVMLIWDNCRTYNMSDSPIFHQADIMERHMQRYCSQHGIPLDLPVKRAKAEPDSQTIELQEKIDLSESLKKISHPALGKVVEMIEKDCPSALHHLPEEKLQLRIDALDEATFKKIAKFTLQELNEDERSEPIKKVKFS